MIERAENHGSGPLGARVVNVLRFLILGVHELERVLERITDDSLASTKNEAQVLRKAVRDYMV